MMMERFSVHRAANSPPRPVTAFGSRIVRAYANGDDGALEDFRAVLEADGFDAHIIPQAEFPEAIRGWSRLVARSRLDGLRPVLIVPIPTQADPLVFEPASNLTGPIDEASGDPGDSRENRES